MTRPTPADLDAIEATARAASLPWVAATFHLKKEGAGKDGMSKTVLTSAAYDAQGLADFSYVTAACLFTPALVAEIRRLQARDAEMAEALEKYAGDALKNAISALREASADRSGENADG